MCSPSVTQQCIGQQRKLAWIIVWLREAYSWQVNHPGVAHSLAGSLQLVLVCPLCVPAHSLAGPGVSPLCPCSHPELVCVLCRAAWLFLLPMPLPGLWLCIFSGTVLFCSLMKHKEMLAILSSLNIFCLLAILSALNIFCLLAAITTKSHVLCKWIFPI